MKNEIEHCLKILGLKRKHLHIPDVKEYDFNFIASILLNLYKTSWEEILNMEIPIESINVDYDTNFSSDYYIKAETLTFKGVKDSVIKSVLSSGSFKDVVMIDCNAYEVDLNSFTGDISDCKFENFNIESSFFEISNCTIKKLTINVDDTHRVDLLNNDIKSLVIKGDLSKFSGEFNATINDINFEDITRFYTYIKLKNNKEYDGAFDAFNSGLFDFKQN